MMGNRIITDLKFWMKCGGLRLVELACSAPVVLELTWQLGDPKVWFLKILNNQNNLCLSAIICNHAMVCHAIMICFKQFDPGLRRLPASWPTHWAFPRPKAGGGWPHPLTSPSRSPSWCQPVRPSANPQGPATHKQKHSHLWFETHCGWNEVIPPQRGLGLSWHLLLGLEELLQGLGIILNLLPGFEVFVGDVRKLLHIFLLSALDVPDQASEVDAVTANKLTTLCLWKPLEWRTYFEELNLLTNRSGCRETFPPQLRCGLPRRPWYLPQANASESETPQTLGNTKVENVGK